MNIIWAKGEVFIRDIVAALPDPKPNYNTVATQVKFLEDKGFVKRKPMAPYCRLRNNNRGKGSFCLGNKGTVRFQVHAGTDASDS